jgi:guanylate kinase
MQHSSGERDRTPCQSTRCLIYPGQDRDVSQSEWVPARILESRGLWDRRPMLVIIGPSASGKSTVARELHRRRVLRVHPTWTTRPRRDEERVGCPEHRFVTDAAFDRLCAQGFFLETVAWVGGVHRYGLPPLPDPSDGPVDAVILRAPFVEAFARRHGGDQLVYQIEDTVERARHRLALRGCPAAELAARLANHQRERLAGRRVAQRVFVNDQSLAVLVEAVAAALRDDLADHSIEQGALAP